MKNLLIAASFVLTSLFSTVSFSSTKPNIVVIMTDDQDDTGSLDTMPILKQELIDKGLRFVNSYATSPLCCPSRVSFLTGQYTHNHQVYTHDPVTGGYAKFSPRENHSLGVWMQNAGYVTGFAGKFLNGFGANGTATHIPPGWNDFNAAFGVAYYDFKLAENGVLHQYAGVNNYFTDVISQKGVDFINANANNTTPFFLVLTPFAPHNTTTSPFYPIPAPRHAGIFADTNFPHRPNFNEDDVSDKPKFISTIPPMSNYAINSVVQNTKARRESLLAVDEMVGNIVQTLKNKGVYDNTIIIFTSDNGWMAGSHRWGGKIVMYEESTKVPLVIKGPGVQIGTRTQLVANIDLTATILDIAGGVPTGNVLDGVSLKPLFTNALAVWRSAILFENWYLFPNTISQYEKYIAIRTSNGYVSSRLWSDSYGREYEFYDLNNDPYQMTNVYGNTNYNTIKNSLDPKLTQLRDCIGSSCWIP